MKSLLQIDSKLVAKFIAVSNFEIDSMARSRLSIVFGTKIRGKSDDAQSCGFTALA